MLYALIRTISQLWIQKLCDEIYTGRNDKRNRNIFLSNLVLCMEEENLTGPFLKNPPTKGKLPNAAEIFGLKGPVVQVITMYIYLMTCL